MQFMIKKNEVQAEKEEQENQEEESEMQAASEEIPEWNICCLCEWTSEG